MAYLVQVHYQGHLQGSGPGDGEGGPGLRYDLNAEPGVGGERLGQVLDSDGELNYIAGVDGRAGPDQPAMGPVHGISGCERVRAAPEGDGGQVGAVLVVLGVVEGERTDADRDR